MALHEGSISPGRYNVIIRGNFKVSHVLYHVLIQETALNLLFIHFNIICKVLEFGAMKSGLFSVKVSLFYSKVNVQFVNLTFGRFLGEFETGVQYRCFAAFCELHFSILPLQED
ncbi:hypothetical protein SAY87_010831 [Trapa incisa]|uniref:Uncharacterized protein n=1 Tax=Trapa incisa TaxID=236973 RepID=A0AAN7JHW7_9MYRT|nr:hypothetical protein SAY87_010831 [Trapa incisa]